MRVSSKQIQNLSLAEQHVLNAEAYLYSSKLICQSMIDNLDFNTYSLACSCMFNARLAVELFLKAALIEKRDNIKLTHVIEELRDEYRRVYPDSRYSWDVPFCLEVYGYKEEDIPSVIKKSVKKHPQDQMLRYPMGRDRKEWGVYSTFSAKEFIVELNKIENDFNRLKYEIFS